MTTQKPTQYIGVTDCTASLVQQLLQVWRQQDEFLTRGKKLHVGVMMSYKTLNLIPGKFLDVFPYRETVADIFWSDEVMNCLHYADFDAIDVAGSLRRAIAYGGERLHAVQLDMIWPDPDAVATAIAASGKQLEVILQVNKIALEQVDRDPAVVVERLRRYEGLISHVLIDMSMGSGKEMAAHEQLPFFRAVHKAFPELGMTAAGGLGPSMCHLASPIVSEHPDVSLDAQGGLRKSKDVRDPIELVRAAEYVQQGLLLLYRHQQQQTTR